MKTRSLVYLSLIYAGSVLVMSFPMEIPIPVISILCGFFVEHFGWKRILLIRGSTIGLNLLVKIHFTLFLFQYDISTFFTVMSGTVIYSVLIMKAVRKITKKRILML